MPIRSDLVHQGRVIVIGTWAIRDIASIIPGDTKSVAVIAGWAEEAEAL